jgi:hypothetical protein
MFQTPKRLRYQHSTLEEDDFMGMFSPMKISNQKTIAMTEVKINTHQILVV